MKVWEVHVLLILTITTQGHLNRCLLQCFLVTNQLLSFSIYSHQPRWRSVMDYSKPSGCTGVLMIYLILVIFHCIRFMDCLKALFKRLFIQKCTMKTSYIRFMHLVFVFIKLKALKKKKKEQKERSFNAFSDNHAYKATPKR